MDPFTTALLVGAGLQVTGAAVDKITGKGNTSSETTVRKVPVKVRRADGTYHTMYVKTGESSSSGTSSDNSATTAALTGLYGAATQKDGVEGALATDKDTIATKAKTLGGGSDQSSDLLTGDADTSDVKEADDLRATTVGLKGKVGGKAKATTRGTLSGGSSDMKKLYKALGVSF